MASRLHKAVKEAEKIKLENPDNPFAGMALIMNEIQRSTSETSDKAIKSAKRKAFFANLFTPAIRIHFSSGFFLPEAVDTDSSGESKAILYKGRIDRPDTFRYATSNTYRICRHESGIIGLVEANDDVTGNLRIPIEISRMLGFDKLDEYMPGSSKALLFSYSDFPDEINSYFDGRLVHRRDLDINVETDGKDDDERKADFLTKLYSMLHNEDLILNGDVIRVGGLTEDEFDVPEYFMQEMSSGEDLRRDAKQYDYTPLGIMMGRRSFLVSRVRRKGGVVGRVYARMNGVVNELHLPMPLLRSLRHNNKKTDIDLVDEAISSEGLEDIFYLKKDMEDCTEYRVLLQGDIVYSRKMGSKKEAYVWTMEQTDKLGDEYIKNASRIMSMM